MNKIGETQLYFYLYINPDVLQLITNNRIIKNDNGITMTDTFTTSVELVDSIIVMVEADAGLNTKASEEKPSTLKSSFSAPINFINQESNH